MSFMGIFPSVRERRLASEEGAYAIDKYGDRADEILLLKAQQTRSNERRMVYKLARQIVLGKHRPMVRDQLSSTALTSGSGDL